MKFTSRRRGPRPRPRKHGSFAVRTLRALAGQAFQPNISRRPSNWPSGFHPVK